LPVFLSDLPGKIQVSLHKIFVTFILDIVLPHRHKWSCSMEKQQSKKTSLQHKQISAILLIGIERYLYDKDDLTATNDLQVPPKDGSVKRRI
jgi:hypothetical protein